jgi:hypothetical protein
MDEKLAKVSGATEAIGPGTGDPFLKKKHRSGLICVCQLKFT